MPVQEGEHFPAPVGESLPQRNTSLSELKVRVISVLQRARIWLLGPGVWEQLWKPAAPDVLTSETRLPLASQRADCPQESEGPTPEHPFPF